jgi:hypothetical protein
MKKMIETTNQFPVPRENFCQRFPPTTVTTTSNFSVQVAGRLAGEDVGSSKSPLLASLLASEPRSFQANCLSGCWFHG